MTDVCGDVPTVHGVLVHDRRGGHGCTAVAAVALDEDFDALLRGTVETEGVGGEALHGGDDGIGAGVQGVDVVHGINLSIGGTRGPGVIVRAARRVPWRTL